MAEIIDRYPPNGYKKLCRVAHKGHNYYYEGPINDDIIDLLEFDSFDNCKLTLKYLDETFIFFPIDNLYLNKKIENINFEIHALKEAMREQGRNNELICYEVMRNKKFITSFSFGFLVGNLLVGLFSAIPPIKFS